MKTFQSTTLIKLINSTFETSLSKIFMHDISKIYEKELHLVKLPIYEYIFSNANILGK